MDLSNKLIIKAKYGDDVRKIAVHTEDMTLDDLQLMMQRIFKNSFSMNDDIVLKYLDEDGDLVTIFDQSDLSFAIQCNRILKLTIYVNGQPGDAVAMATVGEIKEELKEIKDKASNLIRRLELSETALCKAENDASSRGYRDETPSKIKEALPAQSREFDPLDAGERRDVVNGTVERQSITQHQQEHQPTQQLMNSSVELNGPMSNNLEDSRSTTPGSTRNSISGGPAPMGAMPGPPPQSHRSTPGPPEVSQYQPFGNQPPYQPVLSQHQPFPPAPPPQQSPATIHPSLHQEVAGGQTFAGVPPDQGAPPPMRPPIMSSYFGPGKPVPSPATQPTPPPAPTGGPAAQQFGLGPPAPTSEMNGSGPVPVSMAGPPGGPFPPHGGQPMPGFHPGPPMSGAQQMPPTSAGVPPGPPPPPFGTVPTSMNGPGPVPVSMAAQGMPPFGVSQAPQGMQPPTSGIPGFHPQQGSMPPMSSEAQMQPQQQQFGGGMGPPGGMAPPPQQPGPPPQGPPPIPVGGMPAGGNPFSRGGGQFARPNF